MLLELERVKFSYGGAETLRGVSMRIHEGSVVCLIGANGAGKTTTLKLISGLGKPDSGEILFKGKSIAGDDPQSILEMGITQVPQEGRPFPFLTVYENLLMGAFVRKDKKAVREDVAKVYELFPVLRERSSQKSGKLSGGERRMLAIGRALMSKPILLMMDEPSSGLAPVIIQEFRNTIPKMQEEGVSILLVEQNADLALKVAQFGYVMERGEIVLSGLASQLLDNPTVKKAYLGM